MLCKSVGNCYNGAVLKEGTHFENLPGSRYPETEAPGATLISEHANYSEHSQKAKGLMLCLVLLCCGTCIDNRGY